MTDLAETLHLLGYRSEGDSWDTGGRRTYLHEVDATKAVVDILTGILGRLGWKKHDTKLRTFQHWMSCEIIELEPGGSDCTGHYLHHMKAEFAE